MWYATTTNSSATEFVNEKCGVRWWPILPPQRLWRAFAAWEKGIQVYI